MLRLAALAAAAALAIPAGAATIPPEPASPPGVVLDADSYYGTKGSNTKSSPPPERPGEWECWVLRTDHPYVYRLDWRQPSPEWEVAHYREACQHPHSPRRYTSSSAPRFPAAPSPGPPRFVDPSPSDMSRCDGVWRPIARCD